MRRSRKPRTQPRRATIRDIARRAGVSETTVSLSFRSDSRISPKTRQKVFGVAKELRYIPNVLAQSLRSGKTSTIGFVVLDITNPFYARMVKRATDVAHQRGFELVSADSSYAAEKEVAIVQSMIKNRVQGILICPCEKTTEGLKLLASYSLPCIAIDSYPPSYKGPYVINDLARAGFVAGRHLMDIGCRHPAYLDASEEIRGMSSFRAIARGFLTSVVQAGLARSEVPMIPAGMTIEAGTAGFLHLREHFPETDGILCVNDLCAFGVMQAADAAGVRIGEHVALVGIDDLNVSSLSRVSLTSINQPYAELIETATTALIDSVVDGVLPTIRREIPPVLVARDSTLALRKARLAGRSTTDTGDA